MNSLNEKNQAQASQYMNTLLNNISNSGLEMSKDFVNCIIFLVSEYCTIRPTNPNYFRTERLEIHDKIKNMFDFMNKIKDKEKSTRNTFVINDKELSKFTSNEIIKFQVLMNNYYNAYYHTKHLYSKTSTVHVYAKEIDIAETVLQIY